MNYSDIGAMLLLFITIYFLFITGIKLAENSSDNAGLWFIVIPALFFGATVTSANDKIGLLGFIPIMTYIFMQIFANYDRKIKGIFFGALGSVAIEIVATSVVGLAGIEALVSIVIGFLVFGAGLSA